MAENGDRFPPYDEIDVMPRYIRYSQDLAVFSLSELGITLSIILRNLKTVKDLCLCSSQEDQSHQQLQEQAH